MSFRTCGRAEIWLSLAHFRPRVAVSAKDVLMQQVAEETRVAFERRLERARVPAPERPALPEVGALLPRLLPQIRASATFPHEPWAVSWQVGRQAPSVWGG